MTAVRESRASRKEVWPDGSRTWARIMRGVAAQGGSCRGWGLPNTGTQRAGEMTCSLLRHRESTAANP